MGLKLTIEDVSSRVVKISDGLLEVVPNQPYTGKSSLLKFKHTPCNHIFERVVGNVIYNKVLSCPVCEPDKFSRTETKLRELLFEKGLILINVLDTKFGCGDRGRVRLKIIQCGCIFERHIGNCVKSGVKCKKHSEGYGSWKTREEYSETLMSLPFGSFEIVGDFVNASRVSKFKCRKCGHITETRYHKLLNKKGKCSNCFGSAKSVYEEFVSILLNDIGVKFVREYRISSYKYDFYLPDYNLLLEYDGSQHFLKEGESLYSVKNNDKLKDALAVSNGYRIHRIRFDESKTKSILSSLEGSTIIP